MSVSLYLFVKHFNVSQYLDSACISEYLQGCLCKSILVYLCVPPSIWKRLTVSQTVLLSLCVEVGLLFSRRAISALTCVFLSCRACLNQQSRPVLVTSQSGGTSLFTFIPLVSFRSFSVSGFGAFSCCLFLPLVSVRLLLCVRSGQTCAVSVVCFPFCWSEAWAVCWRSLLLVLNVVWWMWAGAWMSCVVEDVLLNSDVLLFW